MPIATVVADIEIDGLHGFYSIWGASQKGQEWIAAKVQNGVDGHTYSDDRRMTQDIANAADDEGLVVTVNDVRYHRIAN